MTNHAAEDIGIVARYLAPRWKAIVATLVPLLGGVIALIASNEFDLNHILGVIATAMSSGVFTHSVENVPVPTTAPAEATTPPASAVVPAPAAAAPSVAAAAPTSQDPDATVSE